MDIATARAGSITEMDLLNLMREITFCKASIGLGNLGESEKVRQP
jgi:hypothetical protein